MPILIKSSGGQRTCKIMTSNSRDDLIEALKGLTFKFEVKIVDVERKPSNHVEGTEPACESRPTIAANNVTEPKLTEAPRRVFVSEPTKVPLVDTSLGNNQSKPLYETKTKVESKADFEPRKKEVEVKKSLEPKPVYEPNPAGPVMVPSILAKKHGIFEKPKKPKLVRGELSSHQQTCCINVERFEYPSVAYIPYSNEKLLEVTKSINEVSSQIQSQPEVRSVDVGDIVFAKSKEDNSWYRSMVDSIIDANTVEVNFFDWGLTEKLELERVRRLTHVDLGLSAHPACAVKVKFTNQPTDPLLHTALSCQAEFDIQVNSYDPKEEAHSVTILRLA